MFETKLTRFFTPPLRGQRSPDPYGSNPAVGARESALVRGGGKLGVPAVRPKPASSASRAAAHNRTWGAKGRRAGGRGDALGNLETHRRRSRCRPALRPLHTARSIRTTAARCLPRAPTYSYSYTSPTGRRRRAAAASCARTSARRASSHNRRPVPASVRARLRARGWVLGRGACGESGA